MYAQFDDFKDEKMGYIDSRKKIYIPEYYNLIKDTERISFWKQKLKEGHNLVVYDFDGPRTAMGDGICFELTLELLIEKINDTTYPFGHGYIVAASIMNIMPEQYLK